MAARGQVDDRGRPRCRRGRSARAPCPSPAPAGSPRRRPPRPGRSASAGPGGRPVSAARKRCCSRSLRLKTIIGAAAKSGEAQRRRGHGQVAHRAQPLHPAALHRHVLGGDRGHRRAGAQQLGRVVLVVLVQLEADRPGSAASAGRNQVCSESALTTTEIRVGTPASRPGPGQRLPLEQRDLAGEADQRPGRPRWPRTAWPGGPAPGRPTCSSALIRWLTADGRDVQPPGGRLEAAVLDHRLEGRQLHRDPHKQILMLREESLAGVRPTTALASRTCSPPPSPVSPRPSCSSSPSARRTRSCCARACAASTYCPVVLICAVSDLALILAGIAGLGAVVAARPAAVTVIRWVGAAFLLALRGAGRRSGRCGRAR